MGSVSGDKSDRKWPSAEEETAAQVLSTEMLTNPIPWLDPPASDVNSLAQASGVPSGNIYNTVVLPSPTTPPRASTSLATTFNSPSGSSVILNINGVRQELPINLNLEKALDPSCMAELGLPIGNLGELSAKYLEGGVAAICGDQTQSAIKAEKGQEEDEAAESDLEPIDMVMRPTERKSARLELKRLLQEGDVKFEPDESYVFHHPWCEECQCIYEYGCTLHVIHKVPHRPLLSWAFASLPTCLTLCSIPGSADGDHSVFAKKFLMNRTTFGPLEGNHVTTPPNNQPKLPIETVDGVMYFNLGNESQCNWMMFLKMARTKWEQNVIVYQEECGLYFRCTQDIDPKTELRYYYAAHYAHHFELAVLDDSCKGENWRFACSECPERFRTASQLQVHSAKHEEDDQVGGEVDEDEEEETALNLMKEVAAPPPQSPQPVINKDFKSRNIFGKNYRFRQYRLLKNRAVQQCQKVTDRLSCNRCLLSFKLPGVLNLHNLSHSKDPNGQDAPENNTCPQCHVTFTDLNQLIKHSAEHGFKPLKPYKCTVCSKRYLTRERLDMHCRVHSLNDSDRPHKCQVCSKRCVTSSALACHAKIHSNQSFFTCLVCRLNGQEMTFKYKASLRQHSETHRQGAGFPCPACHYVLQQFSQLRVHIRSHHPTGRLPCPHCPKVFSRIDKLKLHLVVHSDTKQYMCEQCGRQFKRKDKLKEHTKRLHNPLQKPARRIFSSVINQSKGRAVPNTEYERFIYRCLDCHLGFKRRGMLVNHLVKNHPEKPFSSIPELNLPILRAQKDFFCQHCDKVYRSSSKRKAHILSKHPGAPLPPSLRPARGSSQKPNEQMTFSSTVGSTTSNVQVCHLCPKQYASRPKLLQHLRAQHPDEAPPMRNKRKLYDGEIHGQVVNGQLLLQTIDTPPAPLGDILAQAMNELTQNFTGQQLNGSTGQLALLSDSRLQSMLLATSDLEAVPVSLPQMVLLSTPEAGRVATTPPTNPVSHVTVEPSSMGEEAAFIPFTLTQPSAVG